MTDEPSTSKAYKKDSSESAPLPPHLDFTSPEFDALQALYADPNIQLTKRKPKVIYQNFAAFENDLKEKGLYGMFSKKTKDDIEKKVDKKPLSDPKSTMQGRRFLPHQMATKSTGPRRKNTRNLYRLIEMIEGPQAVLRNCILDNRRIVIHTRSEHGVRGRISGTLISFDKHWNLLLKDVHELWKGRKLRFDQNKFFGTPTDCSERLRNLGITLPPVKVKSLNRKNVQLSKRVPQLLIRGEQIVLVITKKPAEDETNPKS